MGKKVDRPWVDSARGSGRTTRALKSAWEASQDPKGARMVLFVTPLAKLDQYNIQLLAKIADESNFKGVKLSHREVRFKNGGRIRFVNWDDPHLEQWAPSRWRLRGYRPDLPAIWDHHAEDLWAARERRRFEAHLKSESAKLYISPLRDAPPPCCKNECRTMDGGCANCGDPCL